MPTVKATPELLAYIREAGIDLEPTRPAVFHELLPADICEELFQDRVIAFARENGWLVYHTYDARKSEPGFPDTHMLRGPRQVVAELKTMTGKVTAAQKKWVNAYRKAGVEAFVWRPDAWAEIQEKLK